MEAAVPWARLVERLRPLYPKGERGRPPIGLERMLRIYFVQQWYGLADEAVEDALYDSQALRAFAGIELNRDPVPDATTLLKFRHWLEQHELTPGVVRRSGSDAGGARLVDAPEPAPAKAGVRSLMRRSLPPRPRPRTSRRPATRRCTRPGRATSATSGSGISGSGISGSGISGSGISG